jgi:membrane-bound serine protease (ClpP class)
MWLSIILLIAGMIAIFLEIFIPAGGVIGIIGAGCMIGGIVNAYLNIGSLEGTILLVSALVATPVFIALALKVFPHTYFGKKLILDKTLSREEGYSASEEKKYSLLAGQEGIALSPLRPSGMVKIRDSKYSVVTSGEFIAKDAKVRVIQVEGNRIIVREV